MRLRYLLLLSLLGLLPAKALGAENVNDLIARHLKARGGEEKLRAMQSLRMSGTLKSLAGGEGSFEMLQKRPNSIRQQHLQPGKKMIIGFDGKQAWAIDNSSGSDAPFVLSGIQADLIRLQADFDGVFLDWARKGHKVSYVGPEALNNRKVHHIKVLRQDGKVQHFFLDAETFLDQKISLEVVQGGTPLVLESLLSDHKPAGGIVLPHVIESVVNGRPQSKLILGKIEADPVLDDSLFRMPPPPADPGKDKKPPAPKSTVPAKPAKAAPPAPKS